MVRRSLAFCAGLALAALSAEAQQSQPIPLDEHARRILRLMVAQPLAERASVLFLAEPESGVAVLYGLVDAATRSVVRS